MTRNEIGYSIGCFGLGILSASALYPMGFIESNLVFAWMIAIGSFLIMIGLFFRK